MKLMLQRHKQGSPRKLVRIQNKVDYFFGINNAMKGILGPFYTTGMDSINPRGKYFVKFYEKIYKSLNKVKKMQMQENKTLTLLGRKLKEICYKVKQKFGVLLIKNTKYKI